MASRSLSSGLPRPSDWEALEGMTMTFISASPLAQSRAKTRLWRTVCSGGEPGNWGERIQVVLTAPETPRWGSPRPWTLPGPPSCSLSSGLWGAVSRAQESQTTGPSRSAPTQTMVSPKTAQRCEVKDQRSSEENSGREGKRLTRS